MSEGDTIEILYKVKYVYGEKMTVNSLDTKVLIEAYEKALINVDHLKLENPTKSERIAGYFDGTLSKSHLIERKYRFDIGFSRNVSLTIFISSDGYLAVGFVVTNKFF